MAPCERCVCQFCGKSLGLFGIEGFGVWRRRHEKRCRRQEASRSDYNAQHFVRSVLPRPRAVHPHSDHSLETNEEKIRKLPTLLQGTQGAQGGMPSLAAQNQIYLVNVLDRRNEQLIRAVLTEYVKPRRHTQWVDIVANSSSNSSFPPCSFPVLFGFGTSTEILFLRAACRQTFQPLEVVAEQCMNDLPENKSFVLEMVCDLSMKRNLDYIGDQHVWKSCKGLLFLLRRANVLGQRRPDLMDRLLKAFAPLRSDKDWKVQIAANILVTTVESVMTAITVMTPDLPGCVGADVADGLKNLSLTN